MMVDTNILIRIAKGDDTLSAAMQAGDEDWYISRIIYIEFLGFKGFTQAEALQARHYLVDNFMVVELDEEIADRAITVRVGTGLKLPDAIIVATALVLNEKLLTLDGAIQKGFPEIVVHPDAFISQRGTS